jgi:hypothetical protein
MTRCSSFFYIAKDLRLTLRLDVFFLRSLASCDLRLRRFPHSLAALFSCQITKLTTLRFLLFKEVLNWEFPLLHNFCEAVNFFRKLFLQILVIIDLYRFF